jgi:hypothetical protein
MTRIKLKTLELQNTKTKNLCSFQKEKQIPYFPLMKLHTKKSKTLKMTKENSRF